MLAFWAGFPDTPFGIAVTLTALAMAYACITASFVQSSAARGSRPRFLAVSVQRTLAIPAMMLIVPKGIGNAASGNWLTAFFDVILFVTFIIMWRRLRNEDDWWTGRGTRLKKRLNSLASGLSSRGRTATAGA